MTTPTGERTLTLIRHARAENAGDGADLERDLSPRGRKEARAVGAWMSEVSRACAFDLALCSTSERTRQTLEAIVENGVSVRQTRFDPRIYDASAASLFAVLAEVPDSVKTVLMVGHAPGIPVLATALARSDPASSGVQDRLALGFPTCALVILESAGSWAQWGPSTANLKDFVVPPG